jgi:hypothetical protein
MSGATSYRVHADLQIRSNAEQALNRISRALGGLNTRIQATEQRLNRVVGALGGLATHLRPIQLTTQAMQGLQAGASAVSQATQGAFRRACASPPSPGRPMARFAARWPAAWRRQRRLDATGLEYTTSASSPPPLSHASRPARTGAGPR